MPKPTKVKQRDIDCCFEVIDKAVRVGRCRYDCVRCGRDVSLLWFYYQQALDSLPTKVTKKK